MTINYWAEAERAMIMNIDKVFCIIGGLWLI